MLGKRIEKEQLEGQVASPFATTPLPTMRVSALGVVPKKMPDELHIIHHLSHPKEGLLNDAIPDALC